MKKWLLIAFGLVLLFGAQPHCFADGLIFPAQGGKEPQLVQQRAIIVYRDGVERLIVESAFDGEPGDYAFILPVPSEPLEIKKASYPLFKTVFYDLRQKARNSDSITALTICLFAGLVAIITIMFVLALLNGRAVLFSRVGAIALAGLFVVLIWQLTFSLAVPLSVAAVLLFLSGRYPRIISAITFTFLLLSAAFCATPSIVGGLGWSFGPVNAVHIPNVALLERCEDSLLPTGSSDAPAEWLSKNGFSAPGAEDRKVIEACARGGYRFVVVKGHKTATGLSAAAPVEVTFKAGSPVLPTGWIAYAGRPVYADMIIVSDEAYECGELGTEFSEIFKYGPPRTEDGFVSGSIRKVTGLAKVQDLLDRSWQRFFDSFYASIYPPRFLFHWYGAETHRKTYHSEVHNLLWSGCVVSKLSDELTPRKVAGDAVAAKGTVGREKLIEVRKAAIQSAVEDAFTFFLVATMLASIPLLFLRRYRQWRFVRTGRMYLSITCIAVLFGLAMWAVIPTAVAQDARGCGNSTSEARRTFENAFISACEVPGGPAEKLLAMYDPESKKWPTMNDEMRVLLGQLAEAVRRELGPAGLKNDFTGEPFAVEESPGDLFIELESGEAGRLCLSLFGHTEWWESLTDRICHYPR
ncbi:MAG: hypothetical protein WC712_01065 [Candidatus Brocadiia bacterium]